MALKQADDNLADFRQIKAGARVLRDAVRDDATIPMMASADPVWWRHRQCVPDDWAEAMIRLFGSAEAEQRLVRHQPLLNVLFAEGNLTGIKAVDPLGPDRIPVCPDAGHKVTDTLYRAMAELDAVPQRTETESADS